MSSIVSDDDVFLQFTNEKSRKQYRRKWSDFVEFCGDFDFEAGQPDEELLSKYFKYLRNTKKMASSSLWTIYSSLNSIFKRKYSSKLQEMPRLTMLIKGFDNDVKQKAAIFDDNQLKEFMLVRKESAYWLVRQVITIVAFFGGLRIQECMDLVLEKIQRGKEGFFITHFRVKQRRSDKLESRFLVPDEGGFAAQLDLYLGKVNNQLKKYQGRVWYTGTQSGVFRNQVLGKNTMAKVPQEIATLLMRPNPALYSFHSFRRTSATSAADGGSTSAQMTDFFGWKNPSMCHEYVSSSKHAITSMAKTLAVHDSKFSLEDVEVEYEDIEESKEDLSMLHLEEDPDMYAAAGLPLPVPVPVPVSVPMSVGMCSHDIEGTVQHVMSSAAVTSGGNVNIKIVMVSGNSNTTMNF
jgi:integrase